MLRDCLYYVLQRAQYQNAVQCHLPLLAFRQFRFQHLEDEEQTAIMLGTLPEPARPLIHAATMVASKLLYMPLGLMSDLTSGKLYPALATN